MDRQARRTYFERLCNLRNSYETLGTDDTTSVISIEAIIEHAISLLERPVLADDRDARRLAGGELTTSGPSASVTRRAARLPHR